MRVTDGVLDAALLIGVAHAYRVGQYAVLRQHGGVEGVEWRLVQIGFEHALLVVNQHDIAATAAEVAQCLFMQLSQIWWLERQTTRR